LHTGATRISRYDFARLLAKVFGLDESLITPITSDKITWVARRPQDSSLDISKALNTFTNKPLQITEAIRFLKNDII